MVLLRQNPERDAAVMSNHQWALACHLAQTQLERDIRPLRAKFEHELQRRLQEEDQERRARQWELSQLCKEATWAEERNLSLFETTRRREQAYLINEKTKDDMAVESVRRAHEHKARHNDYHRQRKEEMQRRQIYNDRIHAHQAEVASRARQFEETRVSENMKRQEQVAQRREEAAQRRAVQQANMDMQRQLQKEATEARLQAHKEKCEANLNRKAAIFDQKIARVDGLMSARGEAWQEMQKCRLESARQCERLAEMMAQESVTGRGFDEIRSQFEALIPQLRSAPKLRSSSAPQTSRFKARATPARGRSHSFEKRLFENRLREQAYNPNDVDAEASQQALQRQEAEAEALQKDMLQGSISTKAPTTPTCAQSVSVTNSPPSRALSATSTPGMSIMTNAPSLSIPPAVTLRASSTPPGCAGVAYVATTGPATELSFPILTPRSHTTVATPRSHDTVTTFCSPQAVVQGVRAMSTSPGLNHSLKSVSDCGSTTDAGLTPKSIASPHSFRSDNPTSPARTTLLGLTLRPRLNFSPEQR
mmetsp:Transcript_101977/g.186837  ORF Transcript_101977/g.186837 Transcript_101977/m.186837 type:complete len:536 (+) Transcript_101977:97-1704(+)